MVIKQFISALGSSSSQVFFAAFIYILIQSLNMAI